MAEYNKERERFIPLRKSEIVTLLCESGELNPDEQNKFRSFCIIMESLYHFEFHKKLEELKENYHPLNPDKDTYHIQEYSPDEIKTSEDRLLENFKKILNDANYEEITEQDILYAMEKESLFKINLFVDFNDFEKQLIFYRGTRNEKAVIKKWFIKNVEIDVPIFERLAILIKFKDAAYFEAKHRKNLQFEPGSMIIKLFKNIPRADMEMLFPNTQVRMKPKDMAVMGGSVLGGGVGVFLKASAGLIAMASVLWFMIRSFLVGGEIPHVGPKEISGMVGGISALAVIGAFVIKQWNSYKNRKIKFMKVLGDNLYFKNMDNNSGVFFHIIDAAEEEECKEAILSYYFLLQSENGLTEAELDDRIEEWLEYKHHILIDFEIKDALRKLKELELCKIIKNNGKEIYQALPLDDACKRLDYIWDNYFQF